MSRRLSSTAIASWIGVASILFWVAAATVLSAVAAAQGKGHPLSWSPNWDKLGSNPEQVFGQKGAWHGLGTALNQPAALSHARPRERRTVCHLPVA